MSTSDNKYMTSKANHAIYYSSTTSKPLPSCNGSQCGWVIHCKRSNIIITWLWVINPGYKVVVRRKQIATRYMNLSTPSK